MTERMQYNRLIEHLKKKTIANGEINKLHTNEELIEFLDSLNEINLDKFLHVLSIWFVLAREIPVNYVCPYCNRKKHLDVMKKR